MEQKTNKNFLNYVLVNLVGAEGERQRTESFEFCEENLAEKYLMPSSASRGLPA